MGLVLTTREEAILFTIHTTLLLLLLLYSGPQTRTVIHLFWNCTHVFVNCGEILNINIYNNLYNF